MNFYEFSEQKLLVSEGGGGGVSIKLRFQETFYDSRELLKGKVASAKRLNPTVYPRFDPISRPRPRDFATSNKIRSIGFHYLAFLIT